MKKHYLKHWNLYIKAFSISVLMNLLLIFSARCANNFIPQKYTNTFVLLDTTTPKGGSILLKYTLLNSNADTSDLTNEQKKLVSQNIITIKDSTNRYLHLDYPTSGLDTVLYFFDAQKEHINRKNAVFLNNENFFFVLNSPIGWQDYSNLYGYSVTLKKYFNYNNQPCISASIGFIKEKNTIIALSYMDSITHSGEKLEILNLTHFIFKNDSFYLQNCMRFNFPMSSGLEIEKLSKQELYYLLKTFKINSK